MHRFANPARFVRLARPLTAWFGWGGVVLVAIALIGGLVLTPPDYLQGDTVRIMYIHVPAAWLGMAGWAGIAAASITASRPERNPLSIWRTITRPPMNLSAVTVMRAAMARRMRLSTALPRGFRPHSTPSAVAAK